MTQVTSSTSELRRHLAAERRAGKSIGLVPTMGALHEGHLTLLDAARGQCDFNVATIFVNPTQFGAGEDFERYPRTLDADVKLLSSRGVDLIFTPSTDAMYGPRHATTVQVAGPALEWEGRYRRGHFDGVATIVLKLFNLVEPQRAYFGRKDYQQALVVRRMVEDLDLPIVIEVCPTLREADGLAMSSRNVFLSADERKRALAIRKALCLAADLVGRGETDAARIAGEMERLLLKADLKIDYVAIADRETLAALEQVQGPAVALIAARVGKTRLIDNELIGK